jgi:hypothetical protein
MNSTGMTKSKTLYNTNTNATTIRPFEQNSKDLFTGKKTSEMTTSEMINSENKYNADIGKRQDGIISTLKEIKKLSNDSGKEINENTESIKRINDGLDELDHKLNTSEYLVKRFSSWFSYFRSTKNPEPFIKEPDTKERTKFVETTVEITKENDFYDNVSLYLDTIHKDCKTTGQILKENMEDLHTIDSKVDKSDGRIKKTIAKVNKAG